MTSPAKGTTVRSRFVAGLAYVYIVWLAVGIGREARTADRFFWVSVSPVLAMLGAAALLLPGAFLGRPRAVRWMRRLYLAGGILNLLVGGVAAATLRANGRAMFGLDVFLYLLAGVVFLTGFEALSTPRSHAGDQGLRKREELS